MVMVSSLVRWGGTQRGRSTPIQYSREAFTCLPSAEGTTILNRSSESLKEWSAMLADDVFGIAERSGGTACAL